MLGIVGKYLLTKILNVPITLDHSDFSTPQLIQKTFQQRMLAFINGRAKPTGLWSVLTTRRYAADLPEICYRGKKAMFPPPASFVRAAAEMESRGFLVPAYRTLSNNNASPT